MTLIDSIDGDMKCTRKIEGQTSIKLKIKTLIECIQKYTNHYIKCTFLLNEQDQRTILF